LLALILTGGFLLILAAYLFFPWQTNILLLGIDYTESWNFLGRSDTIILASVNPLAPEVRMLSIPRDLWVFIPGIGENRINTAHYFAEGEQPGNGPRKAIETVQSNFGVGIDHYVRVRFEGFKDVVDAMGGVDIMLEEPLAGYPPGSHHLTGNKALAFARSRIGADDFYRMEQGQIIIKAALRQMLLPAHWWQIPGVTIALLRSLDTDIPVWLWPRLGVALLRAGSDGIDNRTIQREMVTPYTTDQGASVLLPNWNLINPLLAEMFGQ
jgi:LCP family protein required for cell wall assembly